MLERLKWPGLALVMGGLAALLSRWQQSSAFEETQGLARPGAPASLALVACLILAAALFFLLARNASCRISKKSRMSRWDYAFAAEGDSIYLTLMVLAGLLTVLAVPFLFREAAQLIALRRATGGGENGMLQLVLALAALAAALAMVVSARNACRMKGLGKEDGVLLLPVVMGCVWLLEAYRANAPDPTIWHYAPLLLAIAMGMLFFMDCAGLSFEAGHARRMLWLAAMTVVTSAGALMSMPGKAMAALLGGQLLAALAALWVVPLNLAHPPAEDRFGLRARLRQGLPLNEDDEHEVEESDSDTQEIQEEDTHV